MDLIGIVFSVFIRQKKMHSVLPLHLTLCYYILFYTTCRLFIYKNCRFLVWNKFMVSPECDLIFFLSCFFCSPQTLVRALRYAMLLKSFQNFLFLLKHLFCVSISFLNFLIQFLVNYRSLYEIDDWRATIFGN